MSGKVKASLPTGGLDLEFVYGYHGSRCRNNLFHLASGELVYFIAATAVVYDPKTNKQRWFYKHTDDIISMAIHPDGNIVATGQMGKEPYVCVWDATTMELLSFCKGFHDRGIASIAFSPDGSEIATVGLDDRFHIACWRWEYGHMLANARGHSDRIFEIAFNPSAPSELVTVGVKHVKFWKYVGSTLSAKKGLFGSKGPIQTMMCAVFDKTGVCYTGTLSGDVYAWKDNKLVQNYSRVHNGPVFTIVLTKGGKAATAGKDGVITVWSTDGNMWKASQKIDLNSKVKTIEKTAVVRALSWNEKAGRIAAGLRTSELVELDADGKNISVVMSGHAEGELWGLATHPTEQIVVTASDDQTVRTWDLKKRAMLNCRPLRSAARSAAFSPDGKHVAVGMRNGTFAVFDSATLEEVPSRSDRRREVIHELKYSPDGTCLAVGCNDNSVVFYDVKDGYTKQGTCTGHASFITHLDWSKDSKYIQTNSGDYEHLLFEAPRGGRNVTTRGLMDEIEWASYTCVIGDPVKGIWPKYADKTDVNAVDRAPNSETLATGDDSGLVKLFSYPTVKKNQKSKHYRGHSSHVTNVRFTAGGEVVLSTGGLDQGIFQWRYNEGDNDSDEGSDDDSDDEFDDEIAKEKGVDYSAAKVKGQGKASVALPAATVGTPAGDVFAGRTSAKAEASANPMSFLPTATVGAKASEVFAGRSRQKKKPSASAGLSTSAAFPGAPPPRSLDLEWAFGYRARDTRNNLYYLATGEAVYHTGAVGVVYDFKGNKQRFYLKHTDDIVSLALHSDKKTVATGQVGREPDIYVWNAETLQTLSRLVGFHSRAVVALSFSNNGLFLASVGDDDDHSVAVYVWNKGIQVATSKGAKEKLFVLEFNPFSHTEFVTVGVRHISFWSVKGNGLDKKRGVFGSNGAMQTLLDISFAENGKAYASGASGDILEWENGKCTRTIKAHEGPCFTITNAEKGFISAGKDGKIRLWDLSFGVLKVIDLCALLKMPADEPAPTIRSIQWEKSKILIGTSQSDIFEVDEDGKDARAILHGHAEGELWGLATHPSSSVFATCSDDKTLRTWDSASRRMLNLAELPESGRACAYSPDGKHLAVGLITGTVLVLDAEKPATMLHKWKYRKEAVHEIKYSPDGKYLAVGSNDNFVDVHDVDNNYKRCGCCKGNSSYITHVDFTKDSKVLMTNSGDYQQLFYDMPRGKRAYIPRDKVVEEDFNWASWTGVLGDDVKGIWPPDSDGTDINTTDLDHARAVLATGDDFGMVKIFNWPPSEEDAKYKKYGGHSAHVTNVRFTHDDSHLVSTGGGDQTILLWKYTDPRGADSDSDAEDGDAFDAVTDAELTQVYLPKAELVTQKAAVVYASRPSKGADIQQAMREEVNQLVEHHVSEPIAPPHSKRPDFAALAAQQSEDLELEWVFGYRGHDCRNNVHYSDKQEVVYHTAGVAVMYSPGEHTQRFYKVHTDDIISFAPAPRGGNTPSGALKDPCIFATGEVGKTPAICCWDSTSGETVSIMKGFHERGVCALCFTASGKRLLSVGLDDNHSIAVYKWLDGSLIASGNGHKDKIFNILAHSTKETEFCTVGVKHIKFWTLTGNQLEGKRGLFGKFQLQSMMCAEYGQGDTCYSGSLSGDIYKWEGTTAVETISAHKGAVYDIYRAENGNFITGGSDGVVRTWSSTFAPMAQIDLSKLPGVMEDPTVDKWVIRSVVMEKGKIILGTLTSEIIEMDERGKKGTILTRGHGKGELWGLAEHPTENKYLTAGDDGTLREWDRDNHRQVQGVRLPEGARSCAYSPDGGHRAVGLLDGSFMVFDKTMKEVTREKHRREALHDMKYSPDGKYLAVGSNDNYVDVYDVERGYRRCGCCQGNSSFITHLDWSTDSQFITTNSGAYEQLYYFAPRGTRAYKRDLKKVTWATQTGVLGDDVSGIWPKYSDKTDVNGASVSPSGRKLVTSDDFGFVKLFDFPATGKNAPHKKYSGHSSHVTNVRFTTDGKYVVSVGGMDKSVFQWRCKANLTL